ncbi:MAG: ribosome-associated translation inhibitor RaiA [Acidobacteriia bacterium]|nr:ribosome-associated translation inhibitor RaiA [Terriglobia bacterium]
MKITYTGRQVELAPAQLKKVEARYAKIGKLLDGRRESEAHIVVSLERHLHHAEATIHYYHHQLVGLGSNTDPFNAICAAADKLEKQAVKVRTKWRDTRRAAKAAPEPEAVEPVGAEAEAESESGTERRVYRINHHRKRKPMTLEEALMEMDKNLPYLVYRDSETDRVSVLVRRRDGDFDLVEA